MDRTFHVYMMASKSGVLYVGMTNNLERRVIQHKQKLNAGFTQKYNVARLVWFEEHARALSAIAREKEIKKWRREKKVALIEAMNPTWKDLGRELG
jgi:putative endonuclease